MSSNITVKLTANFEKNLDSIDLFLHEAGAAQAFDALLDALEQTVIPNLERFPDIGWPFLDRPAGSVEAGNGLDALRKRFTAVAAKCELREYLFADYLLLYAGTDDTIFLLSIKHHRQLSFDLPSLWVGS